MLEWRLPSDPNTIWSSEVDSDDFMVTRTGETLASMSTSSRIFGLQVSDDHAVPSAKASSCAAVVQPWALAIRSRSNTTW